MLLLICVLLALTSVPLLGGRLGRLASLSFRSTPVLVGAIALQVLIISIVPHWPSGMLASAHVGSYVLVGIFVCRNARVSGLWLIAAGGLSNALAIAANGGVMPASARALEVSGLPTSSGFLNSDVIAAPKLSFLGDVFATPESWPLANTFSIGDVLLVLGAFLVIHRACGSKLFAVGSRDFSAVMRRPDFVKAWFAQAISTLGDWVYALGVSVALLADGAGPSALVGLFVAQTAPAVLTGLIGGSLIDRFSRKTVMIVADVLRASALASLFLIDSPALWHYYAASAALGIFGALFAPSLHASLPNLVPKERLVAANALVSATFNFAVMAGPVLGGFLVAELGIRTVIGINMFSFVVSAMLVWSVKATLRAERSDERISVIEHFIEGARYAVRTALVRGIMIVTGLVMVGAAMKGPLEAMFVLDALGGDARSLGVLGGVWGAGMVLGSLAAPAATRRWSRERILCVSVGLVGLATLGAAGAATVSLVAILWFVSGSGNAVGTVAYESLLQERTPDAVRGRVMAALEAIMDAGYLTGAFVGGWIATQYGVRATLAIAGVVFLGASAVSALMVGDGSRRASFARPTVVGVGALVAVISFVGGAMVTAAFAGGVTVALVVVWMLDRARSARTVTANAGVIDAQAIAGEQLGELRQHGWTVLPGATVGTATIDNLVMGPGGILAVHSGWSPALERGISPAMRASVLDAALKEARAGAHAAAAVLEAEGIRIDVHPVLFVHDPRAEADEGMRLIDDVVAFMSNDPEAWRAALCTAKPLGDVERARAALIEVVAASKTSALDPHVVAKPARVF